MHRSLHAMVIGLVAAVALALTGCGAANPPKSHNKPVVLTTFTVLQDIARNIAGDDLTVESITKPGAEIHDYEPTPTTSRRRRRPISFSTTGWAWSAGSRSSWNPPTSRTSSSPRASNR